MATIKTGLTPTKRADGSGNSHQLVRFPIANSYATALFHGDPVKVSAGFVQIATNGANVMGTFDSCEYIDATGRYLNNKYFPANTSSNGLIEDVFSTPMALISPANQELFTARTNTSVTVADVGKIYTVTVGTGSALTGQSAAVIDTSAGAVTAAAGMVRLVALNQTPGSNFNQNPGEVVVEFVNIGLISG